MKKIVLSGAASLIIFIGMMLIAPSNTLDSRLFYTHADAATYLNGLSSYDKTQYLHTEYLDLVFILAYTFFTWYCLKQVALNRGLTFLCDVWDVIETVTIIAVLSGVIEIEAATWLPWVSLIKWISAGVLVVLFLWKLRQCQVKVS